ncbi:MAG: DUF6434 domain-containing protein [Bacteroidota bacterium]
MSKTQNRPFFQEISQVEDFRHWYWKKDELMAICQWLNLPYSGSKLALRERIIYALENGGKLMPPSPTPKAQSRFNWTKANLTLDTLITDNVSFGPNFRNFMKAQIGAQFSCHKDFMDWVKANPGKTLQEAVQKWIAQEKRKEDPHFKRDIAAHNMYNQYIRDFLEAHPDKGLKDAQYYWKLKKQKPAKDGRVFYEAQDLFLDKRDP